MDGIALYPRLRQLDEMSIPKMEAGQASVGRLFKDFDGKVGGVATAGGIKLRDESKGVWKFKVASGTQGKRDVYDLIIYWSDLPKQIAKFGRDKRVWKDDGTGIDLSKLAQAIFDEADIKVQHNCPAWLYWGFKYMATKNKMAYADFERRPPDIRNPQRLGVGCKHFQLWLERIPFYTGTLAGHIGRYYRREVQQAERGILKQKVENG